MLMSIVDVIWDLDYTNVLVNVVTTDHRFKGVNVSSFSYSKMKEESSYIKSFFEVYVEAFLLQNKENKKQKKFCQILHDKWQLQLTLPTFDYLAISLV